MPIVAHGMFHEQASRRSHRFAAIDSRKVANQVIGKIRTARSNGNRPDRARLWQKSQQVLDDSGPAV